MTRKQLERIVEVWKDRLYVRDWNIVVKWDEECPGAGTDAEIRISNDYEQASLRFNADDCGDWDEKKANEVVVHELLHLFENPVKQVSNSLEAALNLDAYQILSAWYSHTAEGLVDRLAIIMVELGGYA